MSLRFFYTSNDKDFVTKKFYYLFINIGMMAGLLGPLLPFLAEHSNSTITESGFLISAFATGAIAGSSLLYLKFFSLSYSKLAKLFLLVFIISILLLPEFKSYLFQLVVSFVIGLVQGYLNSGGNSAILSIWGKMAAKKITISHFSYGLGNIIIPIIITSSFYFFKSDFITFLIISLVVFPSIFFNLETKINSFEASENTKQLSDNSIYLFYTLFFLYVGLELTFSGWLSTIGIIRDLPSELAELLPGIFWFSLTLGRFLLSLLISKFSANRILTISLFALILPFVIIYFDSTILLLTSVFLSGLFLSVIFPTLYTIGNNIYSLEGKRTGNIFIFAGFGGIAIPPFTGYIIDKFGLSYFPVVTISILIIFLVFLLSLRNKFKT
ncbi:MAG: MFS transporter [Candidatus Delongbacteria bacterium]|nr:MFS transporter [Candidatus Delongbacteria bacterium]MBN2835253.1 MFS transporter [Candidatus Delongbacteria bacterium]